MLSPPNYGDKSPRSPDPLLWSRSSTDLDSEPPSPIRSRSKHSSTRACSGARLGRICAALGVISLAFSGTFYLAFTLRNTSESVVAPVQFENVQDFSDNSKLLRNSNATSRLRDNLSLSPEHKFITAWPSSGWTNDVIAAINLIYVASLINRTPIIPPFTPSHVGSIGEVGPLRFGDIFDVPRLANEMGMHILEWEDVKHSALDARVSEGAVESEVEKIGCWSTWAINQIGGGRPRFSEIPALYNLDISYTPVPKSFEISKGFRNDEYYLSAWSLASLSFEKTRAWALSTESSKAFPLMSGSEEKVEPDDKLLCFDLLYYIGLANVEEWATDYAPYWRTVGVHLHWAPKLVELAEGYLRRHFKLQENQAISPFVSIHVRRADFGGWCPPEVNRESCFASPAVYARRVQEIQASLRERGIDAQAVLVTSDERDPKWWEEVSALGPEWGWIDHGIEKTAEKHGKWYPVVLDAVFQSMGAGFVGTDRSTMTLLSQHRVEDWNGGVSTAVRWGTPGADDH